MDSSSSRRDLWATRLYFLLWYAALGFVAPFLNLFYVHLGLNGTQIGWLSAIAAVITLIAAPIWANRTDQWRNPRSVLQLLVFFSGLSYLWLSQQGAFWMIMLVTVVHAVLSAGIPALSDGLALRVTSAARIGYGGVRVYGSLGWMLFVPLAGWVVERTGLHSSLVGSAALSLLAAALLFPIQARHFSTAQATANSIRGVIGKLLHNPTMIGAAWMIVITGVAGSGVWQFQGIYLSELGAAGTLIGIAGMVGSVVELPFMVWADRLTTRWGAYRLLYAAMLVFAAARTAVLLFPSIPLIMAAEATVGVAYSFFTIGLVRFIAEQAGEHETRTVLALYTVTIPSLIGVIGAPVTGFTFDHLGARPLYLIAAIGYLLAWLGLYLARRLSRPY